MNSDVSSQLSHEAVSLIYLVLGHQSGGRYLKQIQLWVDESGSEWTVARLKAVWTAAKQLRAGNPDIARKLYQDNSISYNRKNLLPKGVLGLPVRGFTEGQKPEVIRMWASVLRVYTDLRLERVSDAQLTKVRKSICGPPQYDKNATERIASKIGAWSRSLKVREPRGPSARRLKAFSSYHRLEAKLDQSDRRPYWFFVRSLVSSVYVPECLTDGNPAEEFRQYLLNEAVPDDAASGHIAFIQEGGCKARVVAVPNAWVQLLMEPLHEALDMLIKSLPNSCVHDQVRGAYFAEQLSEAWCYDLSSATDRFPLLVQTELLQALGMDVYAEALSELTEQWSVPLIGEYWDYSVGQPMGLYGSFPLFHLAHYGLLSVLDKDLKESLWEYETDQWRVLGDDVIIGNPYLAEAYGKAMQDLGVELSSTKSIHSKNLFEFAGFITVTTNQGKFSFRPYKCGSGGPFRSPLNYGFSLSRRLKRIQRGPWERFIRPLVESLSWRNPDLSPLLPSIRETRFDPPSIDVPLLTSLLMQAMDLRYGETQASSEAREDHTMLQRSAELILNDEPGRFDYRSGYEVVLPSEEQNTSARKSLMDDPLIAERLKRSSAFGVED